MKLLNSPYNVPCSRCSFLRRSWHLIRSTKSGTEIAGKCVLERASFLNVPQIQTTSNSCHKELYVTVTRCAVCANQIIVRVTDHAALCVTVIQTTSFRNCCVHMTSNNILTFFSTIVPNTRLLPGKKDKRKEKDSLFRQ